MINWKVRFSNKLFWIAIIPAVLALISNILIIFGVVVDFTVLEGQLLGVVESLFVCLAIIGIVMDPTTKGVGDSKQAMEYEKPKED